MLLFVCMRMRMGKGVGGSGGVQAAQGAGGQGGAEGANFVCVHTRTGTWAGHERVVRCADKGRSACHDVLDVHVGGGCCGFFKGMFLGLQDFWILSGSCGLGALVVRGD